MREDWSGFDTHTNLLTSSEWNIIRGLSLRGVAFARRFHSNKTEQLLDAIDSYIHFNASTDAGLYWPGTVHI